MRSWDKAAEIAAFPVRHQRHRPVESDGHPGEAVDVDGLGIHLAVVIDVDGVIDRGDVAVAVLVPIRAMKLRPLRSG